MRRLLSLFVVSMLMSVAWGQTYSYRYWIDNDITTATSGSASGETQFSLDLGSMASGMHALHVQAQNAAGVWSSVHTRYFLNTVQQTATTARYWIDNDLSTMHTGVATSGVIDVDASLLTVGLHTIHYQSFAADGTASVVHTRYLLVNKVHRDMLKASVSIDDGEAATYSLADGDIVIDIAELSAGEHTLRVVLFDDKGNSYGTNESTFNVYQEQTLTLEVLPLLTYGDDAYSLPSETEEGLPLTWTSSKKTVATVTGNQLTIKGAGTATITAKQAGNEDYLPFSRKFALTVNKARLTITANDCSKTEGEENPELTVSYSGFKYDDDATSLTTQPTVTTTATKDSPAGTYPITVSGAKATNYKIYYVNGTLTVNEKAPTINLLYPVATTVHVGDSKDLSIHLDNEDQIIMFEFYMQLPEGLHVNLDADGYYDATLNGDRKDRTHVLEVDKGADGLYHFLCYSNKNKPFLGNEGELLSVNIGCDEGVEAGTYQGVMKNVLLSDADKRAIELQDVTFSIEVVDYTLGDLSGDGKINGMDIVEMVSLIMESGYMPAADLYPVGSPDGIVNGMDLVMEVELVMSQSATQNAPAVPATMDRQLTISESVAGVRTLGIDAHEQFILAQMTVELSEGMTLDDVTCDRHHTATFRQLESNRYAVVCYSNKNAAFDSNASALSFHYTGSGELTVSDVMLVGADRQAYRGAEVRSGASTDISSVTTNGEPFDVFTPDGRVVRRGVVSTDGLAKGVYIVNGQKTVIR